MGHRDRRGQLAQLVPLAHLEVPQGQQVQLAPQEVWVQQVKLLGLSMVASQRLILMEIMEASHLLTQEGQRSAYSDSIS